MENHETEKTKKGGGSSPAKGKFNCGVCGCSASFLFWIPKRKCPASSYGSGLFLQFFFPYRQAAQDPCVWLQVPKNGIRKSSGRFWTAADGQSRDFFFSHFMVFSCDCYTSLATCVIMAGIEPAANQFFPVSGIPLPLRRRHRKGSFFRKTLC